MKSFIVNKNHKSTKLVDIILEEYPTLSFGVLSKAFRKKDVKVNGKRVSGETTVKLNDLIEIYIIDSFFEKDDIFSFEIVYEDDNILIVNKPQGLIVHSDTKETKDTLINKINEYLKEKKQSAKLCHRIDRNTGGIVISAKNEEALKCIKEKLNSNEIEKYYICEVYGIPKKKSALLKAHLTKNAKTGMVYVNERPEKNSLEILTEYKVFKEKKDTSILEIKLLTGRTHQIRAHLAYMGHQIIGDGKYGKNEINKLFKKKKQQLWAYKIVFNLSSPCLLSYLNDRIFKINIPL